MKDYLIKIDCDSCGRHVKFSTPLDEGEWKLIMVRPQESASGAGLLAPFHEVVWYFILVSLIVTGPAIWGIIWMYHRFGKHTGEPYYNLSQCVWYVYGKNFLNVAVNGVDSIDFHPQAV